MTYFTLLFVFFVFFVISHIVSMGVVLYLVLFTLYKLMFCFSICLYAGLITVFQFGTRLFDDD